MTIEGSSNHNINKQSAYVSPHIDTTHVEESSDRYFVAKVANMTTLISTRHTVLINQDINLSKEKLIKNIARITFYPKLLKERGESAHAAQSALVEVQDSDGKYDIVPTVIKIHQGARVEYENTVEVKKRGIVTTTPVAAFSGEIINEQGTKPTGFILLKIQKNLLPSSVMEESYWTIVNEDGMEFSRVFNTNVAKQFAQIHAKGIIHNDPQLKNIAFDTSAPEMELFFYDWENAKIFMSLGEQESLDRFILSNPLLGLTSDNIAPIPELYLEKGKKHTVATDLKIFLQSSFKTFGMKLSFGIDSNLLQDEASTESFSSKSFDGVIKNESNKLIGNFVRSISKNPSIVDTINSLDDFLLHFERSLQPVINPSFRKEMIEEIREQFKENEGLKEIAWRIVKKQLDSQKNASLSENQKEHALRSSLINQKVGIQRILRIYLRKFVTETFWNNFQDDFLSVYYRTLEKENPEIFSLIKERKEDIEEYLHFCITTI